jgi:hypothetical protein
LLACSVGVHVLGILGQKGLVSREGWAAPRQRLSLKHENTHTHTHTCRHRHICARTLHACRRIRMHTHTVHIRWATSARSHGLVTELHCMPRTSVWKNSLIRESRSEWHERVSLSSSHSVMSSVAVSKTSLMISNLVRGKVLETCHVKWLQEHLLLCRPAHEQHDATIHRIIPNACCTRLTTI